MEQWLLNQGPLGVVVLLIASANVWLAKKYTEAKKAHEDDLREMAQTQLAFLKGAKEAGLLSSQSPSQGSKTPT